MIIDYKLDANDFLTYQLYTASKSERIKRKRFRSQIIIPIIYILFVLYNLYRDNTYGIIIFFVLAILWFFLYPLWEKRHYINHYKGFIKENYNDRFNRITTLEFTNDFIWAKDNASESKISTNEIEEINEINSAIFIKFKTGPSLILPKEKIQDIDSLKNWLKELVNSLNVKYNTEENWKWK